MEFLNNKQQTTDHEQLTDNYISCHFTGSTAEPPKYSSVILCLFRHTEDPELFDPPSAGWRRRTSKNQDDKEM